MNGHSIREPTRYVWPKAPERDARIVALEEMLRTETSKRVDADSAAGALIGLLILSIALNVIQVVMK